MDPALHDLGNAGDQVDRPVRCDDSWLHSYFIQWRNYEVFQNMWRDPSREDAVENFEQLDFAREPSALRKEGDTSSGLVFSCRQSRSSSDGWNGWQQASSTIGG